MSTIVTHLYDSFQQAESAVRALEQVGIDKDDISLVSHRYSNDGVKGAPAELREPEDFTAAQAAGRDAAAGGSLGGILGATGGVLAGLGMLAIPGIGPVVAAGWLATAAAGAVAGGVVGAGAGGIVGALSNAGVSNEEAEFYAESVRRGGTLVSAKVPDDMAEAARQVLASTGAVDPIERRRLYEGAGWTRYDSNAPAYTAEEVAAERDRWMLRH
ncbi:hypothetical protein [Novosphingobium sp. KACC 22771]|uniref:hypothetical protein n=1 Tax=Novosphingobium sp. KACC 22771 TaxID=3025670 RepID=UPI0023660FA8|nr:hypothetical protein [Novosphingobium sp. KACC 22771]WDF74040.1 hypothetical protein PQ467_08385 [Novosphingobium sp. KACC 22771]